MSVNHNHIIEQVPIDYYQKGIENNILQRTWHTNKLAAVVSSIKFKPATILDVGCASGWFISKLAINFPAAKCYGIDIYDKAIAYGKKQYPHITFAMGDAHRTPFKKESFDLVVCTEVLEHVDDPKAVLLEIKRVLKKNGVAIIELDSGSWLFSLSWSLWRKFHGKIWNESHQHSFNIRKLTQMIHGCSYEIVSKKKFNLGMAMVFAIRK